MAPAELACLVRIKRGSVTRAHIVVSPEFVIGRSPDVQVPIVSNTISRKHLKVEILKDSVRIWDLKSNNGTYVDGKLIPPERPLVLQPGNTVQLGQSDEIISFLPIPMPVELMDRKGIETTVLSALVQAQKEIEETAFRALEEQKKENEAALKLEWEQARHQMDAQAEARKQSAEAVAKSIKDAAEKEAQNIAAKARQEVNEVQAQAFASHMEKKKELENQIDKLRSEASAILARARVEASEESKKIAVQAQADAKSDIEAAQRRAEVILQSAQGLIEERIQAQDRVLAAIGTKKKELENQIEDLQREAKQILSSARLQAETEAARDFEIASQKCREILESGEKESRLKAEQAEKLRLETLQRAQHEAQVLLESAQKKVAALMDQARKNVQVEIEEKRRTALDAIRVETLEEQNQVVSTYQATIEQLRNHQKVLEPRVNALSVDKETLEKQVLAMQTELSELNKNLVGKKHQFSGILSDVENAKRLITEGEAAAQRAKEAGEQQKNAESAIQELQNEHQRTLKALAQEIQEAKEKKLLQIKDNEKQMEAELNQKRLKNLEMLKTSLLDEEKKYTETLNLRAQEIATKLEPRLLTLLEAEAAKKGVELPLGQFLGTIRQAVDEVLLKHSSAIQVVTEGMGVDHKKVAEQRHQQKKWMTYAGVAAAVLLLALSPRIYTWLRDWARGNSYADYMVAQRTAESIYTPIQSTDWKETYSGNVLYLKNYYEAKIDPSYEKQWALKLNELELLRSLGVSEDDIAQVIGKEAALVRRLWELRQSIDAKYLDEGLAKINDAEAQIVGEVRNILKTDSSYETFRRLERDFTMQFIRRRFGVEKRVPSAE